MKTELEGRRNTEIAAPPRTAQNRSGPFIRARPQGRSSKSRAVLGTTSQISKLRQHPTERRLANDSRSHGQPGGPAHPGVRQASAPRALSRASTSPTTMRMTSTAARPKDPPALSPGGSPHRGPQCRKTETIPVNCRVGLRRPLSRSAQNRLLQRNRWNSVLGR